MFFFIENQDDQKKLRSISLEERHYLNAFLNKLLFYDDFSYVLFGNKPLAYTSFSKSLPLNISHDGASFAHLTLKKGAEVFKKYQRCFSSQKFLTQIHENEDDLILILINKKNFRRTFNKYKKDFQQILGASITNKRLLSIIMKNEDFGDAINNHEALLGILLGYGRDNAWMFHHKKLILRKLRSFDISLREHGLLEKEIANINEQLKPFSDEVAEKSSALKKVDVSLPHFMAILNSEETQQLKKKYENDRKKIKKNLADQNTIDAILNRINR